MFYIILYRESEHFRWRTSKMFSRTYTQKDVAISDLASFNRPNNYEYRIFEVSE